MSYDPIAHAEQMNLNIRFNRILTNRETEYRPGDRTIIIDNQLDQTQQRSALAVQIAMIELQGRKDRRTHYLLLLCKARRIAAARLIDHLNPHVMRAG